MKKTRDQVLLRVESSEALLLDKAVAVVRAGDAVKIEAEIRRELLIMLLQMRAIRILKSLPRNQTNRTKRR